MVCHCLAATRHIQTLLGQTMPKARKEAQLRPVSPPGCWEKLEGQAHESFPKIDQHGLHLKEEETNFREKNRPNHFLQKGIAMKYPLLWVRRGCDNNVKLLRFYKERQRVTTFKVYTLVTRA